MEGGAQDRRTALVLRRGWQVGWQNGVRAGAGPLSDHAPDRAGACRRPPSRVARPAAGPSLRREPRELCPGPPPEPEQEPQPEPGSGRSLPAPGRQGEWTGGRTGRGPLGRGRALQGSRGRRRWPACRARDGVVRAGSASRERRIGPVERVPVERGPEKIGPEKIGPVQIVRARGAGLRPADAVRPGAWLPKRQREWRQARRRSRPPESRSSDHRSGLPPARRPAGRAGPG